MIRGYNAYKLYVGLFTHFTTIKFNYLTHKGTKATESSYRKNNDRYWFIKLEEHYGEKDLLDFFLAQFTANDNYWVGDSFGESCQDKYTNYRKKMAQFTRTINQEINWLFGNFDVTKIYHVDQGYPKIITAYLAGNIGLETMLVIDEVNGWISKSDALVGIVGTPLALKLKKYKPFLNYDVKKFQNNELLREC